MTQAVAVAPAGTVAPQRTPTSFLLSYGDLRIGTLTRRATEWVFEYTLEFHQQSRIQPLVTLPRTDLRYRSNKLWVFFEQRIPNLERLRHQGSIEGVDPNDQLALLAKFGRKTVTDPYTLTPIGDSYET